MCILWPKQTWDKIVGGPKSDGEKNKNKAGSISGQPRQFACPSSRMNAYVRQQSEVLYGHRIQQSIDQPGKVVNPTRDQLKREN